MNYNNSQIMLKERWEGRKMSTPIADMLKRYTDTDVLRMCMPGHKGKLNLADITELADSDNLLAPTGVIARSQELFSREKGASACFYSVAGSSAPIMAMFGYFAPDSEIIVARDFHLSAESGMILSGVRPVYVEIECGIAEPPRVKEEDVIKAIAENKAAKAVYVTYPSFMGRTINLARISEAAHDAGMLLLVDSAHGAHFGYTRQLPEDAGRYADIWSESLHKTLPALGTTAALFASERVDAARLKRALNRVQTTSPNYILLESIDKARDFMAREGAERLEELLKMLSDVRDEIQKIDGLKIFPTDDKTKLVIDVTERGITGFDAARALHDAGVEVESAEPTRILCITTVCDTREDFSRLVAALKELPKGRNKVSDIIYSLKRGTEITPREAALGEVRELEREQAIGEVCAASVYCYPPGVPLIAAGQKIDKADIELLCGLEKAGSEIKPSGKLIVVSSK